MRQIFEFNSERPGAESGVRWAHSEFQTPPASESVIDRFGFWGTSDDGT
jgi:hypothetical protein